MDTYIVGSCLKILSKFFSKVDIIEFNKIIVKWPPSLHVLFFSLFLSFLRFDEESAELLNWMIKSRAVILAAEISNYRKIRDTSDIKGTLKVKGEAGRKWLWIGVLLHSVAVGGMICELSILAIITRFLDLSGYWLPILSKDCNKNVHYLSYCISPVAKSSECLDTCLLVCVQYIYIYCCLHAIEHKPNFNSY